MQSGDRSTYAAALALKSWGGLKELRKEVESLRAAQSEDDKSRGASAFPREVARVVDKAVTRAMESLPTRKDLTDSVTDEVARFNIAETISTSVKNAVAAIPKPKDGKDVDPVEVLKFIRKLVSDSVRAIPTPENGKDADPEQVRAIVQADVAKAVAAMPMPKDGPVGKIPRHEWHGTALRFELPGKKWGQFVDLQGLPGDSFVHRGGSGGVASIPPAADLSTYYTKAQSDARFEPIGEAASAVSGHVGEADPHAQYQKESEKGQANGYASLGADNKVPTTQLPAIAFTDVAVVADEAAQLALTAEEGDVAIRSDLNKSYIHNGGTAGTIADWSELLTPTDAVLSVFGRTGSISAAASDYDASQIDNDSGVAGAFVSDALNTLNSGKQPIDAELSALAGLTSAADKLPYFTGSGTASLADLTPFGRSLIDDANADAVLTTLGVNSGVQTFLKTPSSANLIAAVTDETGTGALVFANTPILTTPNIGAATGTSLVATGNITAQNATSEKIFLGNVGGFSAITFGSAADVVMFRAAADLLQIVDKTLFSAEIEVDGALNHDGATVGFYGATPIARASAYTQTYSTASRTHPAQTATALTGTSVITAWGFQTQAQLDNFIADAEALRQDHLALAQVVNSIIDDLQAIGILQ